MKSFLSHSLLILFFIPQVHSQAKIATVDRDFIFSQHPDTHRMIELLRQKQTEFLKKSDIRQHYIQQKEQEYQEALEKGSLNVDELAEELLELKKDFQSWFKHTESEYKEMERVLWNPIREKIMAAIAAIAAESGYSHVFNQSFEGTSEAIIAPANDNITHRVMRRLGIKQIYPPREKP